MNLNKPIKTETYMSFNIIGLLFLSSIPIVAILFFYKQPIIGIFFVSVFILFIFYTIYKQDKRFASVYKWERIEAKVKSKKIVKYTCLTMYRKWNTAKSSYKIDIKYQYEYNGVIVTSNQYAMPYKGDADCNFLYTLDEAEKTMDAITKDKKVTVYVNLSNPEESIIMQGKSKQYGISYPILFMYMVGLFYLLFKVYYV